jgi:hypothetical protein
MEGQRPEEEVSRIRILDHPARPAVSSLKAPPIARRVSITTSIFGAQFCGYLSSRLTHTRALVSDSSDELLLVYPGVFQPTLQWVESYTTCRV